MVIKYCTAVCDIPADQHFAIIENGTVYGEDYVSVGIIKYFSFSSEDEWKQKITENTLKNTPFVAMKSLPAKITQTVTVNIE